MKGVKQRTGCYELGEERCRCAPREAAMGFGRDPALSGMAGLIATRPEPLGRKARINRFGVDCGEGLEWQAGWEPGGEYTKTVVVKNVSTRLIKLKYRLPETKYFSMAYPETISLVPGMAKALQAASRSPLSS
jgi:hypothetical protein|tara:strand:+ start:260 stop:658 length:399 start_codon:yes stop_codon:yes gene_type:complete